MPKMIAQAVAHWQRGNRLEAERLCAAIIATSAGQIEAHGLLAEIYSTQREYGQAAEQLRRITALRPREAAWHRRLGDALFALGEFAGAAASFRVATGLEPRQPRAHNNLGRALAALGEHDAAADCYRQAIGLDPRYAIAHNNLGIELAELRQLEPALAAYQEAARFNPKLAEAHSNRGNVLLKLRRAAEALAAQDRALELEPYNGTYHCNRGNALFRLRRFEEALKCFDRALGLQPQSPEGYNGRGVALRELQRLEPALECFDRAIELKPDYLEPLSNKANVLLCLERFEELLPWCERLVELKEDSTLAHYYHGLALNNLGREREAIESMGRVLQLSASDPLAGGYLMYAAARICDWSHEELLTRIFDGVRKDTVTVSPFVFLGLSGDADLQLQCARGHFAHCCNTPPEPLWTGERWQNDKLRIAYVSGDLRDHAVSFLMAGVFEKHDRARFSPIGVTLRPAVPSDFGLRVVHSFDMWLDVHEVSDLKVAQILRDLQVDIAVDLMGYTRGARIEIFAHRFAPVQMSYLGFPGATGTPFHDYILADDFVIPPGSERFYSENVIHLPECFQANDDQRRISERRPTRAEAGLPEEAFVFCSFNNSYKVTARQFDVWCRLLAAVPRGVLWIVADNQDAQSNLRREACARGVAAERLVFAQRMEYADHLARLPLADLFLDTLPFNAGTTASDALWAGVPVLTCSGEAFASRMAGSLLRTVGLPELITHSLADYEAVAVRLAGNPKELAGLRARLAVNRDSSPLFDTERFCRHLERAYVGMWERAERGEAPHSFPVEPIAQVRKRSVAPAAASVPAADSSLLAQVAQHRQRGELECAETLLRRLLQAAPQHRDALHQLGTVCVQTQRAEEGIALIRESLRIDAAQPAAHMHLAIALRRLGRAHEAIACFDQALVLRPDLAEALYNRGNALADLGKLEEAVADLEKALHLKPQFLAALGRLSELLVQLARYPEALIRFAQIVQQVPEDDSTPCELLTLRGNALRELGRAEEALGSFERALRLDQDSALLWNDRGLVLRDLKRIDEALESIARSLRLAPEFAEAFSNQGDALRDAQRFAEALASYETALRLKPGLGVAHRGRGVTLRALGRVGEALSAFGEAARAGANRVDLLNQRGNAFLDLERFEEALASFEQALELIPDQPDLLWNRGVALRRLKRYAEATECYARLNERSPGRDLVPGLVVHCRLERCDWRDYAATRERLLSGLAPDVCTVEPFTLLTLTDSAAAQLQCARNYAARNRPTAELPPLPVAGYRHRRIRLAYISADLREHAVSYLMAGVFETHDRERFEVIALSLRPAEDNAMSRRLQGAFDRFIDVSGRGEAEIAALMRELEADIAVDLMGYTQHQKSAVFSYRPAPVQVTYLGYPGTTGSAALDYIIADEFVIPREQQRHYSEQVVYLPDCFQANDDRRTAVPTPTRAAVGLPDGVLVFCCFNTNGKHSPPLFDVWCRLLAAVPGSVLWLIAGSSEIRDNLRREAVQRGADPGRLVFAGSLPYSLHLARVALADLFLDTFPFSAGATASDALWAGVPLLTCTGEAYASRMAGSLLRALGLPELITHSLEEYAERALALARDPATLAALRSRLRENRHTRGVFDTTPFCRRLERAYVAMVERAGRGEPPQGFSVE
jgi:predicted O-linked N-acetylglucosamine transferase (SPINDLY family)